MLPFHGDSAAASESCSASCAGLRSESDRLSLKRLSAQQCRIDRFIRENHTYWRDRRLLDKLVRSRALYDAVRSQLLSDNTISCDSNAVLKLINFTPVKENLEVKNSDLVDKEAVLGPRKLYECWSCCNSKCPRGVKTKKARSHRRRHGGWLLVSNSGTDSNQGSDSKIYFKAKLVKSEPCTFKFHSLMKDQLKVFSESGSATHPSSSTHDRLLGSVNTRKRKKINVYYYKFKRYDNCNSSISGNMFYPLQKSNQHRLEEKIWKDKPEPNPSGHVKLENSKQKWSYPDDSPFQNNIHDSARENYSIEKQENFRKRLFLCDTNSGMALKKKSNTSFNRDYSKLRTDNSKAYPFYESLKKSDIMFNTENSANEIYQGSKAEGLLPNCFNVKCSKIYLSRATNISTCISKKGGNSISHHEQLHRQMMKTRPLMQVSENMPYSGRYKNVFVNSPNVSKLYQCKKQSNIKKNMDAQDLERCPCSRKANPKRELRPLACIDNIRQPFSFEDKAKDANTSCHIIKSDNNHEINKRCAQNDFTQVTKIEENHCNQPVDSPKTHIQSNTDKEVVPYNNSQSNEVQETNKFNTICIEIPPDSQPPNTKNKKTTPVTKHQKVRDPSGLDHKRLKNKLRKCFCTLKLEKSKKTEKENEFKNTGFEQRQCPGCDLEKHRPGKCFRKKIKVPCHENPASKPHNCTTCCPNKLKLNVPLLIKQSPVKRCSLLQKKIDNNNSLNLINNNVPTEPQKIVLVIKIEKKEKCSQIIPAVKRCFCDLKLHKKGRNTTAEHIECVGTHISDVKIVTDLKTTDECKAFKSASVSVHMLKNVCLSKALLIKPQINEKQTSTRNDKRTKKSQSKIRMRNKIVGISPKLKRCFCTLLIRDGYRTKEIKNQCNSFKFRNSVNVYALSKVVVASTRIQGPTISLPRKTDPILSNLNSHYELSASNQWQYHLNERLTSFVSFSTMEIRSKTVPSLFQDSKLNIISPVELSTKSTINCLQNKCNSILRHNCPLQFNDHLERSTVLANSQLTGISPYLKKCYCTMNIQISGRPCQTGVCVPNECDPIQCQKLVMNRFMKKSKPSCPPVLSPKPGRPVYGVKSCLSFDAYVSADNICTQERSNSDGYGSDSSSRKTAGGRRYRRHNMESQSDSQKFQSRGSGPSMKRCFCTLKLQKMGKSQMYRNISVNQGTSTPIKSKVASTNVDASQNTKSARRDKRKKLSPYECEPGICVPGECNPKECLELINKRRNRSRGAGSFDSNSYSSSVGRNEKYYSDSSKQALRIGSNISFNVEFYKDNSPRAEEDPCATRRDIKYSSRRNNRYSQDPSKGSFMKRCLCTLKLLTGGAGTSVTPTKDTKTKETKKSSTKQVTQKSQTSGRKRSSTSKHYECEPGICVPRSCNPYECAKLPKSGMRRAYDTRETPGPVIRFGSNINFGLELYKEQFPNSSRVQAEAQARRNYRNFQGETKSLEGSGVGSKFKRCFCTSKLNKRLSSKETTNQGTATGTNTKVVPTLRSRSVMASNKNKTDRSGFSQYECEPNVCVPGSCDPNECEKRIKQRQQRQVRDNRMEDGHSYDSDNSPSRQAIRIGSTLSFNVEFYKDSSPGGINFSSKPTRNCQVKARRQRCTSTGVTSLIKRCFCTLKLQKNQKELTPTEQRAIGIETDKVTDQANIHSVDKGTGTKKGSSQKKYRVLEPYECEPGVCTPGQCDPNSCLKRIKERDSGSERYKGRSVSSFKSESAKSRSRRIQAERYELSRGDGRSTERGRYYDNDSPTRQAIRIGSSVSFNIEFYKDCSPQDPCSPKRAPICKPICSPSGRVIGCERNRRGSKRYRNASTYSEGGFHHTSSQSLGTRMESRGSGAGTMLKRCFCTLKLQKLGYEQRIDQRIDYTQKNISTLTPMKNRVDNVSISAKEVGIETKNGPRNLKSYECEPGVCVPGTCDPNQCLERIKQRNYGSSKYVHRPHPSRAVEDLNRQVVRFGSNLNFNIECYMDRNGSRGESQRDFQGRVCKRRFTVQRASINYTNKTEIMNIIKGITNKEITQSHSVQFQSQEYQESTKNVYNKRALHGSLNTMHIKTIKNKNASNPLRIPSSKLLKSSKYEPSTDNKHKCYNNLANIDNKSRSFGSILKSCFCISRLDGQSTPLRCPKTATFGQVVRLKPYPYVYQNYCMHCQQDLNSGFKSTPKEKTKHYYKKVNNEKLDKNCPSKMKTIMSYSSSKFKKSDNYGVINKDKALEKRQVIQNKHDRQSFKMVERCTAKERINYTIDSSKESNNKRPAFFKRFIHCCSQVFSIWNGSRTSKNDEMSEAKPTVKKHGHKTPHTLKYSKDKHSSKLVESSELTISKLASIANFDKTYSEKKTFFGYQAAGEQIHAISCHKNKLHQNEYYYSNIKQRKNSTNISSFFNLNRKSRNPPCSRVRTCDYSVQLETNDVITKSKTREQLNYSKDLDNKIFFQKCSRSTTSSLNFSKNKSLRYISPFQRQKFNVYFASTQPMPNSTGLDTPTPLEEPKSCKCIGRCACAKIKKPKTCQCIGKCKCCVCTEKKYKELEKETKKKLTKPKINKCSCGSTICSKEFKKLSDAKTLEKLQAMKKPKPCICGSKICKRETKRIAQHPKGVRGKIRSVCQCAMIFQRTKEDKAAAKKLQLESEKKALIKSREQWEVIKKQQDALDKREKVLDKRKQAKAKKRRIARIKREKIKRKEYLARMARYKVEDAARAKERIASDIKMMKAVKKYANTGDCMLFTESALDIAKLGLVSAGDIIRCATKAVIDPKHTALSVMQTLSEPDRAWSRLKSTADQSPGLSTLRRVRWRLSQTTLFKRGKDVLEYYPTTDFLIHPTDAKGRALRKKQRRRRPTVDFQCNPYMLSLRKRPWLVVYLTCPWFYPHCMSLVQVWRQFTDILMFILAVGVWCPCFLAVEACRACTFCLFCAQ